MFFYLWIVTKLRFSHLHSCAGYKLHFELDFADLDRP